LYNETNNSSNFSIKLKNKTMESSNSSPVDSRSLNQDFSTNLDFREAFNQLFSLPPNNFTISRNSNLSVSPFGSTESVFLSNGNPAGVSDIIRSPRLQGFPSQSNIADNIEAIYNSPIYDLSTNISVNSSFSSLNGAHFYEEVTNI
jgi:hypothetical protein